MNELASCEEAYPACIVYEYPHKICRKGVEDCIIGGTSVNERLSIKLGKKLKMAKK
jgi:hypothetical protein